jgi:hypothetical protein
MGSGAVRKIAPKNRALTLCQSPNAPCALYPVTWVLLLTPFFTIKKTEAKRDGDFFAFVLALYFEMGSLCVSQAGLKRMDLSPELPECWGYRCSLPSPARDSNFLRSSS